MKQSSSVLVMTFFFFSGMIASAFPDEPAKSESVSVGSKLFTESVILGEVVSHLIRAEGSVPDHRAELGGTQILWKALLAGDIDVYPEYTGTIAQEILAGVSVADEASMREELARMNVEMSGRLGFNNTYALGMKEERAEALGIRTISDLAKHPDLKFGFSDEFMERNDGWPGLKRRYNLPHVGVRGLDHNLAYRGLNSGSLDLTDLYSTDAEIKYYGLRVLEDDQGYFPVYHGVLLYRKDLAERNPDLAARLNSLAGTISNKEMTAMNAAVKIDKESESRVAAQFLTSALGLEIDASAESSRELLMRRIRRLAQNTGEHLFLVVISLTAAVIVAVPLGVLAFKVPKMGQVILGTVGVIQTLPSLAVLVFMIPLLGLGAWPAIVALFLYSLLPIVRNTCTGLTEIPASLQESAMVLGLPPRARLWLVELPIASRSILSGIKTAAVINVGTATIGALIGAGGFGQPILTGIRLDDVGLILQGAIPAAILALLVQGGFDRLEQVLVPAGLRISRTT